MKQYHDLLQHIMENGIDRTDRTGTGTRSVFGYQMRFDLSEGFPLLTTKKIHTKSVVGELLWFLRGDTNISWLKERGITIWDEWADENGDLGPVYGHQWRHWDVRDEDSSYIDQIEAVIETLRKDPFSRRIIVSAWNVAEIPDMALPPCHSFFQFYVTPDKNGAPHKLSLQLYQRSADTFLGVPFNIASYALLVHIIAKEVGLEVGEFVHTLGDAHIYHNHFEQVKTQLERDSRALPQLLIKDRIASEGEILPDYDIEDFTFVGYNPHPAIKAPVAV